MVQSIWSHLWYIQRYDTTNRGTDNSALLDTSKKLGIAFGIVFENWSNGFVISSKLKHSNSLTSKMQCKRNFLILVKWVKIITSRTGLPRIMNNLHQHDNNKWPTLRDSKHSQTHLKWLKIWNISSLVWTLNTPKEVSHETFLGTKYSIANTTFYHCLTLTQKCRIGHCSKWDFTEWLRMAVCLHGTSGYAKFKVLETLKTS